LDDRGFSRLAKGAKPEHTPVCEDLATERNAENTDHEDVKKLDDRGFSRLAKGAKPEHTPVCEDLATERNAENTDQAISSIDREAYHLALLSRAIFQ